jgi:hypothetical protein
VDNDCLRDLANLQRQPALYTRYREFVLIVTDKSSGRLLSEDYGVSSLFPSLQVGELLTRHGKIQVHTLENFLFSDDVNPPEAHPVSYD